MIRVVILSDAGAEIEIHELSGDQRSDVVALAEYMLSECADAEALEEEQAEGDGEDGWGGEVA